MRVSVFSQSHGLAMSNAESPIPSVRFDDKRVFFSFEDGREVSVPLSLLPRLSNGSVEDRQIWQACGAGAGLHWPRLDEDVSIEWLLRMPCEPVLGSR